MHDDFATSARPALVKLRQRLSESQNHRCAFCAIVMTLDQGYRNSAVPVKVDRSSERNYHNSVAACVNCNSFQANFASVWAFFEHVRAHGGPLPERHRKRKELREARRIDPNYEAKLALYRQIIGEGVGDPDYMGVPAGIEKLPLDRVREIAEQARDRMIARGPTVSRSVRNKKLTRLHFIGKRHSKPPVTKDANSATFVWDFVRSIRGLRVYLSGCQNHRCCYCHIGMEDIDISNESVIDATDYFGHAITLEHVVSFEEGGGDNLGNLVAACYACNHRRGIMKLSAEAFYEFVQANGDFHAACAEAIRRGRKRRIVRSRSRLISLA